MSQQIENHLKPTDSHKTLKEYIIEDFDSDENTSFEEISNLKKLTANIEMLEDVERIINQHCRKSNYLKSEEFIGMYHWSEYRKSSMKNWSLDQDLILGFPDCYQNNKFPNFINNSSMEEDIRKLSIRISIYFQQSNEYDKSCYESYRKYLVDETDSDTGDDDSSHDDQSDDDSNIDYDYPIIIAPEKIYDILFFLGFYSMFDFGFQIDKMDDYYWETERSNIIQKIISKKPTSKLRYHGGKTTRLPNTSLGSVWDLNYCPLCRYGVSEMKEFDLKQCIHEQHIYTVRQQQFQYNYNERIEWCGTMEMNNQSLYKHILDMNKRCWLHHIFLKYLEYFYPKTLISTKKIVNRNIGKPLGSVFIANNNLSAKFSAYSLNW